MESIIAFDSIIRATSTVWMQVSFPVVAKHFKLRSCSERILPTFILLSWRLRFVLPNKANELNNTI